jgi:hypothetical protein
MLTRIRRSCGLYKKLNAEVPLTCVAADVALDFIKVECGSAAAVWDTPPLEKLRVNGHFCGVSLAFRHSRAAA